MDILNTNPNYSTCELYYRASLKIAESLSEDVQAFKVERDSSGGLEFTKLTFSRVDDKGSRIDADEANRLGGCFKRFAFEIKNEQVIAVRSINEVRKDSYISFYIFDGEEEKFVFTNNEPKVFSLDDGVY